MSKRPAQGRGSGGRVTPSPKSTAPSSSTGSTSSSKRTARAASDAAAKDKAKAKAKPTSGSAKSTKAEPTGGAGRTKARVPQPTAKGTAAREKAARRSPAPSRSAKARGEVAETTTARKGRDGVEEPAATEEAPRRGLLSQLFGPATEDAYVPAKERERPWWGMGDMVLWFVVAQVAAAVAFFVAAGAFGYSLYWPVGPGSAIGEAVGRLGVGQAVSVTKTVADMPIELTTALQIPLWIGFVAGPFITVKRKGISMARDFGLRMEKRDVPLGLAIGVFSQLVLITLLYKIIFLFSPEQDVSAAARELTDKATSPLGVVTVLLVVAIGAPFAEELFFRGLSQHAIAKRLGPWWGVVLGAVFFAFAHGQSLQFPGLLLFGLILGYLTKRYDRLGPAMWAHAGFNIVTAVLLIGNLTLPWSV